MTSYKILKYILKKLKKIIYFSTIPLIYFFILLNTRSIFFKIGILSAKGRISQFTTYIEPELRYEKKYKFIFLNPGNIPNIELYRMYKRYAYIYSRSDYFKYQIYYLIFKIMGYLKLSNIIDLGLYPERHCNAWNRYQPVINFTKDEQARGRKALNEMEIHNQDYICLGIREPAYYKTLDSRLSNEASDQYSHRNPNMADYAEVAECLIQLGYMVVKVGSVSDIELTQYNMPDKVIDYSKIYRTEFNDIFLHGNANFIIAGGSGNFCLGSIFNKPIVQTDQYNPGARPLRRGIYSFQLNIGLINIVDS